MTFLKCTAQWLNLLGEGTNNYFATNCLSYQFTIVISGVKSIFWINLSKQRGVLLSITLVCLILDLQYFQKWLFYYINRQHFFLYCPVRPTLAKLNLSAIKSSCKMEFMITLSHHRQTLSSYEILSLKMAVLIEILRFFQFQHLKYPTSICSKGHFLVKMTTFI